MGDHITGHRDGQRACDQLLAALRSHFPDVERKHAKAMCAFHEAGRANFAFAYHRKTMPRIDIWFPSLAGEVYEPLGTARPVIRKKFGTPWANNWAWHFEIETARQAKDGAEFLLPFARRKRRGRQAPSTIAEELPDTLDPEHMEGAASRVFVNRYERDPKARARCIKIFGARCNACQFDFGSVFGAQFAGLITVHHVKPLASIGKTYRVDPSKDLVPLCPNCHLLAHQRTPPYSVDELRDLLRAQGHLR